MILTLTYFKCWENKIFNLPDNGTVLISGKSGKGKTSILEAINFALFGKGRKIVTIGHKKCKVFFQYDNFKITRTRCPNRLHLISNNSEYEDEAAQEIINKFFGKFFNIIGYMQQNSLNSFLLLNPLDKLEFLEKLSFQKINISSIKKKTKNLLKDRKDELLENKSQIQILTEIIQNKENGIIKVDKPSKLYSLKNAETRYKNTEIKIKNLQKKIKSLENGLTSTKILNKFLEEFNENFNNKKDKLEKSKKEISPINIEGINEKLLDVKQDYKNLKKYREKKRLVKSMEKFSSKIKNIDEILWENGSKDDTKENIEIFEQYVKDIIIVNRLKTKLKSLIFTDNYNKLKHQLSLSKNVKCPNCNTNLNYDIEKEILVVSNNPIIIDKEELIKKIKSHENNIKIKDRLTSQILEIKSNYEDFNIDEYNDIEIEMKNFKTYYEKNISLEYEKKTLQKSVNKIVKKLDKNINEIRIDCGLEEDELVEQISSLKIIIANYKNQSNFIITLEQEISELSLKHKREMAKYIKKYGKILKKEQFEKKIKEKENQMIILENEKKTNYQQLKNNEKYQNYKINLKELKTLQNKFKLLEKNNKILRDKLSSTMLLQTKIKEAESISITNIIQSINNYAKNYLDLFFTEDLITVSLLSFNEDKKPKINISIDYKGMNCELKMLSGGEIQRIVLAFNLALSDMFNLPILLLDESTSNLDQELTNTVINGIKSNYNNKLVILIAHQVISGIFDNVIEI